MFVLAFDIDTFVFALKIKQYCSHQGMIPAEHASRQQIRFVSNQMPIIRPEWVAGYPLTVTFSTISW
jgi:hypothetical protein